MTEDEIMRRFESGETVVVTHGLPPNKRVTLAGGGAVPPTLWPRLFGFAVPVDPCLFPDAPPQTVRCRDR